MINQLINDTNYQRLNYLTNDKLITNDKLTNK